MLYTDTGALSRGKMQKPRAPNLWINIYRKNRPEPMSPAALNTVLDIGKK
jgi:hypothetical protein